MARKKENLQKIFDWLWLKMTEKDKKWLKDNIPAIWGKRLTDKWKRRYAHEVIGLSFRVQEILMAKTKREWHIEIGNMGLPKQCLLELAAMAGITSIRGEGRVYEIMDAIINKISENK